VRFLEDLTWDKWKSSPEKSNEGLGDFDTIFEEVAAAAAERYYSRKI